MSPCSTKKKLGLPATVIVEVTLERHDDEVLERFGRVLATLPEVLEAFHGVLHHRFAQKSPEPGRAITRGPQASQQLGSYLHL